MCVKSDLSYIKKERLAAGGAPVAVKRIAANRSTKIRTSLYNCI
jgi:hypothetical protein